MPIETASYLSQLNPNYPASTDPLEQGDDHLRLIKSVLQSTFPNLTGAVTATQASLNSPFVMPVGAILMYGSGTAPTGWGLCDGSTYTRADASGSIVSPDLRDRFIVGAGPMSGAAGIEGGSRTATVTINTAPEATATGSTSAAGAVAAPTVVIGDTALTIAQMPAHTHGNGIADDNVGNIFINGTMTAAGATQGLDNAGGGPLQGLTTSTGTGATHTHTATVSGGGAADHTHSVSTTVPAHSHPASTVATVPPFYAVQFIMKL